MGFEKYNNNNNNNCNNSVALVGERTIPTERQQIVGEVSANSCEWRASRGQLNGFPDRILGFLDRMKLRHGCKFHLFTRIYLSKCMILQNAKVHYVEGKCVSVSVQRALSVDAMVFRHSVYPNILPELLWCTEHAL
jgi:hypothetical protein